MTLVSVQLEDALQALVDTRLDTIDRMLLGRMPRQDRLEIVKDVESQIYEQLHEHGVENLGRDDVLAVLARLDPPEAYLPEGGESDRPASAPIPSRARSPESVRRRELLMARASGILGLSALGVIFSVVPLVCLIGTQLNSNLFLLVGLFGSTALAFTGGVVGLVLGIRSRKSGGWAIAGIVTCAIALLLSFVGGIFLLLDLLSS